MDNIAGLNAISLFLTGLSNAVDQKLLSLEQARFLTKKILKDNNLLFNLEERRGENAFSKKSKGRLESS